MNAFRWAVAYLLLVVGGGLVLVATDSFGLPVSTGSYEIPFGLGVGILFLTYGIVRLAATAEHRRTRVIGWAGLFVGFSLSFVVYYAGIGLLVITGVGLFAVVFGTDTQPTVESV